MNKYIVFWIAVIVGFAVATGSTAVTAQAEDVYVCANKGVTDSALSQTELKNIYLGKKARWSDNQRVVCVMLGDSPCKESFLRQFIAKSSFQFNNYWKKQIFTGKGQPPQAFASEQELIDYVSQTTGAIGFLCSRPSTAKIKLLTVR